MNVVIYFGNSEVPYFYKLLSYDDKFAIVSKNDVEHLLEYTPLGWKVVGINQPHSISFHEEATLDQCDNMYSQYKTSCDRYWNFWIAPKQKHDYYVDIINKLKMCLNNRLNHHYKCEEGIDLVHLNAMKKIESKIMVAKLWDSLNYEYPNVVTYNDDINLLLTNELESLVEEILLFNKDLLYEQWYLLFGDLDYQIDKVNTAILLHNLRIITK